MLTYFRLKSKLFIFLSLSFIVCLAQDNISKADYERAASFHYTNVYEKVYNLSINPYWFPDSSGVHYVHKSTEESKYLKILFPSNQKSDLFDHDRLAKALSEKLEKEIDGKKLELSRIIYKSKNELQFTVHRKSFILNLESYELTKPEKTKQANRFEEKSPDEKWVAYAKDHNLYIKSTESDEIRQMSKDGKKGYEFGSYYNWADIMEGENGERPKQFWASFSKDGAWLASDICDLTNANKMFLLDWTGEKSYRPKLLSYYRGSPGDTTMVHLIPVFYNTKTGKEIRLDNLRGTHINNANIIWSENPDIVYIYKADRGYNKINLYRLNLKTEKLEVLYSEKSKTNIDNFRYRIQEKSNRIIIHSEKSGWRQLYSLNLKTKKMKSITNGSYVVNSIVKIDDDKKQIYFMASGKEQDRNPYYQHLYRISFKGSGLTLLTEENKHHQISLSPDGNYFVDNFSTVNSPTQTILRSTDNGSILIRMGKADVSELKNWTAPETFETIARDGKTKIYGAFWKPTNFDPNKKYPIIDNSYTGPHTQVFPKRFSRALSRQALAELGFIVVVVDGLGSSGRSKAFHDYSYKNLGGGLEDHILAIKELGKRHKWIDTSKVGIYGHSAGGYDAGRAVTAFGDFYKVAVASSADHDHRMEKAWWPEMYMGWPVDTAYHKQSNITNAGNLKGKLLITHGGIDENVNPSASFKLAEALINADKQFDMMIFPSQRHGYRGPHMFYFTKLRWNYFVEHLKGAEPIWDFDWK